MRLNYIDCCDNVQGLQRLPDNCIDLTVTSPPYDNLREYKCFSWDFEGLAAELYRVTKPGGVIVWVVADATVKGSETGTSFKQALFFKEIGFNLHDTMIFAKKNPIPQTHNRYEQCFEYMFILSKGRPKTFNPITEACLSAGTKRRRKHATELDTKQCMRVREEETTVKATKRASNILYYAVGLDRTGHPATFPVQLATDHIISWSNPGDVVLDPFMGSGTTAVACLRTGRNYIGFELSSEYCDIAEQRIAAEISQQEEWMT